MKKPLVFNLALLALAIGFLSGIWFSRHFSDLADRDLQISGQVDKADVTLRALNLLRESSTNTEPFLEIQLDDEIVSLGRLIANTPVSERRESDLLMLRKLKDYRTKFPHKSEQPEMDNKIAQAFAVLDEKH